MSETIKKYQILSEDAYCDLRLFLNNIANGFTYQAYELLFKKLAKNGSLEITLNEANEIHFLSLATAANITGCKLFYDTKDEKVSLGTCFRIWGAKKQGAQFRASTASSITEIPQSLLDDVVGELIDHVIKLVEEQKTDILVVPLETNIFSRHDVAVQLLEKCKGKSFKLKLTTETLVDYLYDYTSWI